MINEFIQILKTWPIFFQFLYITFACYFTFCLVSDLLTKGFHFISNSLPIILHGWPVGAEVEESDDEFIDENEDVKEDSSEEKK